MCFVVCGVITDMRTMISDLRTMIRTANPIIAEEILTGWMSMIH